MLEIILPWPARPLWPNKRSFWASKARAVLAARTCAWEETLLAAWAQDQSSETIDLSRAEIPVEITFNPPNRIRRDRDNQSAACKAYLDGLADAMGINDTKFVPTPHQGAIVRGGQVIFRIS